MHGRLLLKRHLFEKIVASLDFENWLYIVGGTELMHGFPTGGAWLNKVKVDWFLIGL